MCRNIESQDLEEEKKFHKSYSKDHRNVYDRSGDDGALGGCSCRSSATTAAADDSDGNSGGADANACLLSHLLSSSLFFFL